MITKYHFSALTREKIVLSFFQMPGEENTQQCFASEYKNNGKLRCEEFLVVGTYLRLFGTDICFCFYVVRVRGFGLRLYITLILKFQVTCGLMFFALWKFLGQKYPKNKVAKSQ